MSSVCDSAFLSTRTLNRRFREQLGTTPLHWLLHARVRRAQALLETTKHSVESIATKVGFNSAGALREQFQKLICTSPQAYRRAFSRRVNGPVSSSDRFRASASVTIEQLNVRAAPAAEADVESATGVPAQPVAEGVARSGG